MSLARKTKTYAARSGLGPPFGDPVTTGMRVEYCSVAANNTCTRVEYCSVAADTTGWGPGSSVGIGSWTVRRSNPGKGEISAPVLPSAGTHPASCAMVTRSLSRG